VDLMRDLQRAGARVRVVMTRSAAELVRPALFEALSGGRVGVELWADRAAGEESEGDYARFPHLDFARGIDAVVIAPATANILGKAAAGLADDLLSTTLLAIDPAETPVVFVPSMNATMYENPAVRANRAVLRERGYALLAPGEGALACGEVGIGRWPGNEFVLAALDRLLNGRGRMAGRRVVVSAGPTQVDIDPVRVVTNRSSGRMGFAVAEACWLEGADVVIVHGPTSVSPPPFVETVAVRTPEEMSAAVRAELEGADQLWMAAAVSDWRPIETAGQKLKKADWDGVLEMEPTEDILARAAVERAPGTTLIGFALETEDVSEAAAEKLRAKGCDWLVVNDPRQEGAGFEHDTNRVFVLGRDGSRTEFDLMSKRELARRLVDLVLDRAAAPTAARP
jgi:phosphopantothenoylcysteine decarboxylase/phosphopantothenate--cysteine ligase